MKQDMIVILDLGSTENTTIARAIRSLGVYSEIYPHDITPEELAALPNVRGVILNGGPNRVVDGQAIDVAPGVYACGLPVLAVDHPAAAENQAPWPQDEDALLDLSLIHISFEKKPYKLQEIYGYAAIPRV